MTANGRGTRGSSVLRDRHWRGVWRGCGLFGRGLGISLRFGFLWSFPIDSACGMGAASSCLLLWFLAKIKYPLSGISGLPHKRFFRPHGHSSVLCGPGKIPCLYLAWTVLLTHHTKV